MSRQGEVINFLLDIYISRSGGGAMVRAVEMLNYDIFSVITSSETWEWLFDWVFHKMIYTFVWKNI